MACRVTSRWIRPKETIRLWRGARRISPLPGDAPETERNNISYLNPRAGSRQAAQGKASLFFYLTVKMNRATSPNERAVFQGRA